MDNQNNKYKIIALFGPSASGKDTILKKMVSEHGLHPVISCTTRPPRDNEVDGVDYTFLTDTEMLQKIIDDELLEAEIFNNWAYGTLKSALSADKLNIGVWTPTGIEAMLECKNIYVYPVYCKCSDKTRLIRSLNRETSSDIDEIIRRYHADKKMFASIDFECISIDTETGSGMELLSELINIIK